MNPIRSYKFQCSRRRQPFLLAFLQMVDRLDRHVLRVVLCCVFQQRLAPSSYLHRILLQPNQLLNVQGVRGARKNSIERFFLIVQLQLISLYLLLQSLVLVLLLTQKPLQAVDLFHIFLSAWSDFNQFLNLLQGVFIDFDRILSLELNV
jgi:steroid 5-alpha reductase family enzyme